MKIEKIISKIDKLELEMAIVEPVDFPKGIVQISHGMAEHKERYYNFMNLLAISGYIAVIHDHRGHGASVKKKEDLGNFYTEDSNVIVEDLHQITQYAKERYPSLPLYMFSHSMGTLVARNYLKQYDDEIKKLILSGPPTKNSFAKVGIALAKLMKHWKSGSSILDELTFGGYQQKYLEKNEWLCSNREIVKKYNEDELCGYLFTTNGFLNLYQLMQDAFQKKGWNLKNPDLKIFVIAGKDDPVIQNEKKFNELIDFLKEIGYQQISAKLYEGKRHELLNEIEHQWVEKDILRFLEESE